MRRSFLSMSALSFGLSALFALAMPARADDAAVGALSMHPPAEALVFATSLLAAPQASLAVEAPTTTHGLFTTQSARPAGGPAEATPSPALARDASGTAERTEDVAALWATQPGRALAVAPLSAEQPPGSDAATAVRIAPIEDLHVTTLKFSR